MVTSYELFTELVRCSFLGGNQVIDAKEFTLEPTILLKYDFLRSSPEFGPKTQMNRLFIEFLTLDFKKTAKSELYRKTKGGLTKVSMKERLNNIPLEKIFFLFHFLVIHL